jgi:hypothetical protein
MADKPPILSAAHKLGIALTKRGTEYVGLCPLHEDRTPSFSVNPKKGVFCCYGCGAGGDAYDLVMAVTGCDFRAAKEYLGVTDEGPTREELRRRAIMRELRQWGRDYLSILVTLRGIYLRIADIEMRAMFDGETQELSHYIDTILMGSDEELIALAHSVATEGGVI